MSFIYIGILFIFLALLLYVILICDNFFFLNIIYLLSVIYLLYYSLFGPFFGGNPNDCNCQSPAIRYAEIYL